MRGGAFPSQKQHPKPPNRLWPAGNGATNVRAPIRPPPVSLSLENRSQAGYLRSWGRVYSGVNTLTEIYGLIDPLSQELRYVGKTSQGINRRLKEHRNDALNRRRGSYSSKWLRKLYGFGFEPEVEVFETVEGDTWADSEQFWIAYWRSLGCRLTNLTAGGEGLWGHKRPRDVIERGVAKRRGMKMSDEAKARMRAAWTPERKAAHGAKRRKPRPQKRTKAEINALIAERQKAAWARSPDRRAAARAMAEVVLRAPEAIAKMAATKRGRPASGSQLRGLAVGWSRKRAPVSEATKEKLRAYWASRRVNA